MSPVGILICGFTLVANFNQPSDAHGFKDIKLQKYWDHDLDLSRSRDVIGHVTTGFAMCGFLLVVNMNRRCISHGC